MYIFPADPSEVVALVGFLEDRHVRLLPIEKRAPLRKPGDGWNAAFSSYLEEAGCPLISESAPFSAPHLLDYLRWLINYAISLDYEENAKAINAAAAEALSEGKQGSSSNSAAASGRTVAAVPPAAEALIKQLAELLKVNIDGRDALQALQTIHRAVRQRVIPALTAQERAEKAAAAAAATSSDGAGAGSSSSSGSSARTGASRPGPVPPASQLVDLKTFPLGFSTGNEVADKAAAVLRMLYITDLRELQDAVNDILVTVQEWTGEEAQRATASGTCCTSSR